MVVYFANCNSPILAIAGSQRLRRCHVLWHTWPFAIGWLIQRITTKFGQWHRPAPFSPRSFFARTSDAFIWLFNTLFQLFTTPSALAPALHSSASWETAATFAPPGHAAGAMGDPQAGLVAAGCRREPTRPSHAAEPCVGCLGPLGI